MKLKYLYFLFIPFTLFIFLPSLHAQNKRIELLTQYKNLPAKFTPYLTKGRIAIFNRTEAQNLILAKPSSFILVFKFENKDWEIVLEQNNIFSKSFFATTSTNPTNQFLYENAAMHYKGFIKGKSHSIAAVSIMNNKIVAVIADEGGNINIGAINTAEAELLNEHIIYRENDLILKNKFECNASDLSGNNNNPIPNYATQAPTAATINAEPIDVYFEADYQTYLNNGSNVTNTLNYVTALFNVVKLMYENDSINVQISAIKIWNTVDPYVSIATSSPVLSAFSSNMSIGFPGDLAHLLSQRSIGGGVAYLNSICSTNGQKTAVSGNLTNSFNPLPLYSWPVMVITHEMGHNLGSPHTQSCSWPGGAIDNCYPTEGGCPQGPTPTNGGTVMSYCHLNIGINLANGFGPLPGQKIRNIIRNNSCLNPVVYFETTNQNINEENADVENGCFDYKLLTTKLKIPYAPTQPVSITLVPSGNVTIGSNKDVEVSPLTFTLDATNLSQTINFKVYNDAEIEAPEFLTVNFNINPNGGNAVKRNSSITHSVTITNEDHLPDSTIDQPLYYEPFNGIVSGLGNWTQNVTYGSLSPNRWTIGNSGDAEFSTKAAYISNNGNSLAYAGSVVNDSTVVRIESPLINANGFSNMHLTYLYKCNGEYNFLNGGANGGGFVYVDYGKVLMSTDNGITWTVIKDNIAGRFQKTLEDILLPATANNMANLKIAFVWYNNSSVVNNFPLIIDSINIKGTATSPIQTLAHAGNVDDEYLGPNQTVHYYNPITKNIMATIENLSSFDFGCTKVEIIRTGNGATNAWNNLPSDMVSDKVYKIAAINNNSSAPYNVKLYYTDNEINGLLTAIGNSINSIRIVKTSADLSQANPATPSVFSSEYNRVLYGATSHHVFSSNFTGFSTFGLMKPFGNADCPTAQNVFTTTIMGSNYQWQVNDGAGYIAVSDNGVYQNTTTNTLQINNAPGQYFGNTYRCVVTTVFGEVYSPECILQRGMTWTGSVSTAWENPLNWSCNAVPDNKTDVYINAGSPFYPEINSTTTIKSLTAFSASAVIIKNGVKLNIIEP